MNELFPPLLDPASLGDRVLCIAPHPDDEVLGCGGALALHARRGHTVRVVVASDGAAGGDAAARLEESRRAAAELGVADVRSLGLPDGRVGAAWDLVQRLQAELEEFAPDVVYAPSPFEHHPDHRAVSAAAMSALAGGPRRRVLLYGVNAPVPHAALLDTTSAWDAKRAALACFATQLEGQDLLAKAEACDRARTVNVDDPAVVHAEGFTVLDSDRLPSFEDRAQRLLACLQPAEAPRAVDAPALDPDFARDSARARGLPRTTAVVSTWNKRDDVRANLEALRAQTLPFDEIVVVDNCSSDGTADMIRDEFPDVRLIVMPHSRYGACETFNVGFASSRTELTAILDDDIVMPPEWLEKTTHRLLAEPETTAVLSTKVVEPGTPESYSNSDAVNRERYMSTFRGCASLARTEALRRAEYYDERLFIYGNERDLTCRLLNLGYRVLQYPQVETFHKTPFGIKMGKRSLYYHSRNVWLTMLKYAPLRDLVRLPWLAFTKVVLRADEDESAGEVTDATGTIGIGRSLRETPGGFWIVARAGFSVLANVPYCLKHRQPVTSPDFELPLR